MYRTETKDRETTLKEEGAYPQDYDQELELEADVMKSLMLRHPVAHGRGTSNRVELGEDDHHACSLLGR